MRRNKNRKPNRYEMKIIMLKLGFIALGIYLLGALLYKLYEYIINTVG